MKYMISKKFMLAIWWFGFSINRFDRGLTFKPYNVISLWRLTLDWCPARILFMWDSCPCNKYPFGVRYIKGSV